MRERGDFSREAGEAGEAGEAQRSANANQPLPSVRLAHSVKLDVDLVSLLMENR